MLNRRAFLAAIGSTTVLVSSCSFANEATISDPVADAVEKVIQSKQALIADATRLSTSEPTIRAALQVVIDQNLVHIEALSPNLSTSATPLPTVSAAQVVDLPALTTRCALFSTNNLVTAISLPDPELSRVLALIAGSEMQHHALLLGLIT